jgi:hypothetical protein
MLQMGKRETSGDLVLVLLFVLLLILIRVGVF